MNWHLQENERQMPWKGEKNPYKIWLSEIILQQTRVEQGLHYYEKFITHFPTIVDLANANDEFVFKLWEGLGYYNRCKNLLFTARDIVNRYQGNFPNIYAEIVQLKGVGPYTAAAIASFAYNLPFAVVDGNVYRVLARYFAIFTPTDSTTGKQLFTELANEVIDKQEPALYNQAIMDFGATVCKPVNPICNQCVLQQHCKAYHTVSVPKLPVKEKMLTKKNRWFYYFILEFNQQVWVQKRTVKDIWENLFEFYLVEANEQILWNKNTVDEWLQSQLNVKEAEVAHFSSLLKQQLTHQQIKGQFIHVKLSQMPELLKSGSWHSLAQIADLAFPKFIHQYFQQPTSKQGLLL